MLGIFDSGIGGLTVVRELLRRSPNTSFVYLGDTARAPYGNKSPELVQRYAAEDVAFLLDRGATDVIIACNTVSSLGLDFLRKTYPHIRFFDVISPAIHQIVKAKFQRIGVIGTRATIQSGAYETKLRQMIESLEICSAACPLFVPLVEEGWINRPETKRIARIYLQPLRMKQIQALVLGCTHYPLLEPAIRSAIQRRVTIINSPSALFDEIQEQGKDLLEKRGEQEYFFTDRSDLTDKIASRWLGQSVRGKKAELG